MKCVPLQKLMVTFSLLTPLMLQSIDFAYVGNREDGTMSVIRLSDDSVRATITVGEQPYSIAISPDNLFAYVVNLGSQNVSKVSLITRTVVTTILLAGFPEGIAITPNGDLAYVSDNMNSVVYKIDLATDTVVNTIAGFASPGGLVVNNAGTVVFVANEGSSQASYLNVATDAVTSGQILAAMKDVFLNPAGTNGYLFRAANDAVYACTAGDTLGFQTIFFVNNPTGMAFTPNGGSYFGYVVSAGDNTVRKYDLSGPTFLTATNVATSPFGIAVTSDNLYSYVTASSMGVGTVNKIDLSNNTVVGTISVGAGARAIVIRGGPLLDPPSNFQGTQFRDDAGVQYSLVNHLSWDPILNVDLLGYNIYRNGIFVTRLSPTATSYEEYLIDQGVTTQYSISSVSFDFASSTSTVTVP